MDHLNYYKTFLIKYIIVRLLFLSPLFGVMVLNAQRKDISLNQNWQTALNKTNKWQQVNIPHNWDDYYGYRRMLHGNLHGDAIYKKTFTFKENKSDKQFFLFFEGVGSYARVFVNNIFVGQHNGGRTTFTLNISKAIKTDGSPNSVIVEVAHPANIQDLPWVCGGCSEERGFSEGSQPLGIFRPVHLIVTNNIRVVPFGIHAWSEIENEKANLHIDATIKNYSTQNKKLILLHELRNSDGKTISSIQQNENILPQDSLVFRAPNWKLSNLHLWSISDPYLYKIVTIIKENNQILDQVETAFGFRTINFKSATHQFLLNNQPVFINGIAEYEHQIGGSHAFASEEIDARFKWILGAGFNAFRDAHQPHNLLYGKHCDENGMLWWTQFSAHIWYDTRAFRENFKTLLKEWVIERRNEPALILWGLQNESKLPKDFAEECSALIRSLDPTASSQRLITTCNGGEGTDWDVPQNWTGTYGGNPASYDKDLKKQILVGEYGAWRSIEMHSENRNYQDNNYSEDRNTEILETKVNLANKVKDNVAGHFMWLLNSHDNPGRVQGGEGLREMDRIGPVNYKGLLTSWEEPTDAFYMYRSNFADKNKEPMVYIVSHTWPNRWMQPGMKDSIIVYSNCDEVELFNDIDNASLGKQKRNGIGTHFQWDKANIQYNILYAVGYVAGKAVARDTISLFHLPEAPNFEKLYANVINLTKPQSGYNYLYRINCGGPEYKDENGNSWISDNAFLKTWTDDFPELPQNFASQQRTFPPIKNSRDWKLFQSFRYGKQKLKFEFNVPDGEYLVELYFIEPWLGIGGGFDARKMRLFDVAFNDKIILKDLDIWNEVGENKVLKKIIKAKSVNDKIIIDFPNIKVGQAVISAIAIANNKNNIQPVAPKSIIKIEKCQDCKMQSWLDIGDKVNNHSEATINSLPSNLFGADWLQIDQPQQGDSIVFTVNEDADIFIGAKKGDKLVLQNKDFENTKTEIITDENKGTVYEVFRYRFKKGSKAQLRISEQNILTFVPVNNMQPASDLKPTVQYKANLVSAMEGTKKDTVNGRLCAVVDSKSKVLIDFPVQMGVADKYAFTVKYYFHENKKIKGKIQIINSNKNLMQEEELNFNFTKPTKWNQFTFNSNTMLNAGNYIVRFILEDADGLSISSIEVQ